METNNDTVIHLVDEAIRALSGAAYHGTYAVDWLPIRKPSLLFLRAHVRFQ